MKKISNLLWKSECSRTEVFGMDTDLTIKEFQTVKFRSDAQTRWKETRRAVYFKEKGERVCRPSGQTVVETEVTKRVWKDAQSALQILFFENSDLIPLFIHLCSLMPCPSKRVRLPTTVPLHSWWRGKVLWRHFSWHCICFVPLLSNRLGVLDISCQHWRYRFTKNNWLPEIHERVFTNSMCPLTPSPPHSLSRRRVASLYLRTVESPSKTA